MLQLNEYVAPTDVFDAIAADMVPAVRDIEVRITEQVKDSLAVLCTVFHKLPGSREHRHSQPGEHPRYETGRLLESIQGLTEREGDFITFAVDTDVSYAPVLELRMDRPIFKGVLEQYEDVLLNAAADVIEGK